MFEQEVELEQRQGSVVPLLLIILMIVAFVGVAAYYVVQNRKVLPATEASSLIEESLKEGGPVTIQFRTGMVIGSVADRPHGPNYRFLEKAGLVNIGKDKGRATPVTLTAEGRQLLAELPGVSKAKDNKDGTDIYTVPVAKRALSGTPTVTMTGTGRARAEFTWVWEPNKVGDMLDASGPLVKSFNTWDRGTLIDKFNAKFYHGAPTKAAMAFSMGDKGWQIATE
ncbi:MAG: hypothetical protein WA628_07595 [Terriglobales bacterium]